MLRMLRIPLGRPWMHYFTVPNVPEICSDATLTVRAKTLLWTLYFTVPNVPEICPDATLTVQAKGDLLGHGKYVGVLGENGETLGKLFVTAGDYEAGPSANACKDGAAECTSVFMSDETINEAEEEDGIVIPRALMTAFAADGVLAFGLYVEAGNLATEVTIMSYAFEFGLGGCFSRRLLKFPFGLGGCFSRRLLKGCTARPTATPAYA
ncbi:hypothetical protein T484DRAFT_1794846 [Baffinella frigidus]|nr:hypothetical protein T484DRAFT_1794846 [Cryptophyta sp. CCMP2293]